MIDFEEELNKYEYILTVEEVAQKVGLEKEENDFVKLLEMINEKIDEKIEEKSDESKESKE